MHKTLVLGVLLLFALSGSVPSGDQSLISASETGTISAAGIPQVAPVSPKTQVPKTPAVAKAPQLNPALVAVNNMLDAASQMSHQYQRFQREVASIYQNPAMMQNIFNKSPNLRAKLDAVNYSPVGRGVTDLMQETEELSVTLRQTLAQLAQSNKK